MGIRLRVFHNRRMLHRVDPVAAVHSPVSNANPPPPKAA